MPKRKDLKRRVRARMRKTGEAYTTARRHLLAKSTKNAAGRRAALPSADVCAERAGMTNAAVRAKTGKTWRQWTAALDAAGATDLSHRDIARHVAAEYDVSAWWAQSVTVGYERIRGLREKGQRRDATAGTFDANRSRTYPVPVEELWRACRNVARRRRWIPGTNPEVRKATPPKSLRLLWEDGTTVQMWFVAKGDAKSTVAVQHGRLPSKAAVEDRKRFWAERLDALGELLRG
jgi:uncharacterized protein YndB with AHSA1/START domain